MLRNQRLKDDPPVVRREAAAALAELSRQVMRGTPLVEIFRSAAEIAGWVLNARSTRIWEFKSGTRTLQLVEGHGIPESEKHIVRVSLDDKDPIVDCFLNRQPTTNGAGSPSITPTVAAVIEGKGMPYGVIAAYSGTADQNFSEQRSAFLQAVANTLASAIHLARDTTELSQRERKQGAVAELSRKVLLGASLSDTFRDVTKTLADLGGYDYCSVIRFEPDRNKLVIAESYGLSTDQRNFQMDVDSEFPSAQALRSREPVVVKLTDPNGERALGPLLLPFGVVCALSTVIRGKDIPYGTLSVGCKTLRDFSESDIAFVESLANTLAAAIQRSASDES
jgi:GAF domain-containing protein